MARKWWGHPLIKIILFVVGWLACGVVGFGVANADFKAKWCRNEEGWDLYHASRSWHNLIPLVIDGPAAIISAVFFPFPAELHLKGWSITDTCPHAQ